MSNAWVIVAQCAYALMLLGLLSPNLELLRKFFLAGSACAIVYSLASEKEPLWVPLTWHAGFIFFNGIQVLRLGQRKRKERLDPLELFLKKTSFATFPPEEIKTFVRFGMEGAAPVGQFMARAGEPAREIACILQGSVGIFSEGAKIADVVAGRLVGTTVLMGETENPHDIVASTEVKAIVWTCAAIDEWVGKNANRLSLIQGAAGAQLVEQLLEEAAARKRAHAGLQSNEQAQQHQLRDIA